METVEMLLLFDYYGDLLTDRQRQCIDYRYNQDLSFGEIASEMGISRQGVFDNIARAEARMAKMEEKTGFVRRDLEHRKAMQTIAACVDRLSSHTDPLVRETAARIGAVVNSIEE